MAQSFWLMKSEPSVFSIQHLAKRPKKTSSWDGVRNYQARNHMRAMKSGDGVLFYHSSDDPIGVAGTAEVVKEAHPDLTAQDPASQYFDPKATPENPRWWMVDVKWTATFSRLLPLAELRAHTSLQNMALLQRGTRLSVTPVSPAEWKVILRLAAAKGP